MCSTATNSTGSRRLSIGRCSTPESGVTLIELVVVMTLIGIIGIVATLAIRDPIRAYADTNRRAQLTDIADTALRRMARDIRRSLPNSPRTTGSNPVFLELLLTKTGGRYREQSEGGAEALDFSATDTVFDSLGPLSSLPGQKPAANDVLVVHNLFAVGSTQANAYTHGQADCASATSSTCNSALITAVSDQAGGTRITFQDRRFPLPSPGNRFHVIEKSPVTFRCDPGPIDAGGNGTGTLRRISNYDIASTQPTAFGATAVQAVLARNVTACDITYTALVLTQSLGLVSLQLELTRGGETVRLYHEVHVSNIP